MAQMLRKTPNQTHAQELVSLRNGRPVDELLRELYVERRLPLVQIAAELGVTRVTVSMWLREFGIERPVPLTT